MSSTLARRRPIRVARIAQWLVTGAALLLPQTASALGIFGSHKNDTYSANTHPGRNGPLTAKEFAMAKAAWAYFDAHTEKSTGLANAVGDFPSTTMWDTASYISALVSARELGIITKQEFDRRTIKLLATLRSLDLFRGEMPNKVYHTKTGAKVAYNNKPGEVGYSGMDVGRLLIWLKIIEQRYPYLANAADNVPLRWNFCNAVSDHGYLHSAGIDPKTGQTTRYREGRLGYEEYAAKGYGLWGFRTDRASRAYPFEIREIYTVHVPFDARDPRSTGQFPIEAAEGIGDPDLGRLELVERRALARQQERALLCLSVRNRDVEFLGVGDDLVLGLHQAPGLVRRADQFRHRHGRHRDLPDDQQQDDQHRPAPDRRERGKPAWACRRQGAGQVHRSVPPSLAVRFVKNLRAPHQAGIGPRWCQFR